MVSNKEKVEMHHLFTEKNLGYVHIARIYGVKSIEVVDIVAEVEQKKKDFETREPVVYRKNYKNPARKPKAHELKIPMPDERKEKSPKGYVPNPAMAEAFKMLMLGGAKALMSDEFKFDGNETSGKRKK